MFLRRALIVGPLVLAFLNAGPAWATCTSPAGVAGDQVYNSTNNLMEFCNGSSWVAMGANLAVGTLTTGDACTTDGSYINCTTSPVTTINGVGCTLGGSCTVTISGSNVALAVGITPISGGANKQLVYQDTSGSFDEAANVAWASPFLGIGTLAPGAQLHLSTANAISAPAWTTNGIGIRQDAQTYTDSSSSGTVASNYVDVIGQPTLAASSATTYTKAATMYIAGPPAAGSNVAITNPVALLVGSGNVGIGTATPQEMLDVAGVIKVAGTGSETCDTAHVGAIRYNPTTGLPQMCINH